MPASEKVISPGVFTNEIDQSFLPAAVGEIGAAIIGPTVKGPALVPTVVTSFSEFETKFGTTFTSGSTGGQSLTYLTSIAAENYLKHAGKLTVVRILDGTFTEASANVPQGLFDGTTYTGSFNGTTAPKLNHHTDASASFKIHTLAHGAVMNTSTSSGGWEGFGLDANDSGIGANNVLTRGLKHNLRWEISNVDPGKGSFTLLIRQGNDSHKRKAILESWNNLTLDPNAQNFILKRIGDQSYKIQGSADDPYLYLSGSFPNKSKYVRIEAVQQTVDYLNENGEVRINAYSASLPGLGSGSFAGGDNGYAGFDVDGTFQGTNTSDNKYTFYDEISTHTQGYTPDDLVDSEGGYAYAQALNLLANADEYDINMILLPGLLDSTHTAVTNKAIDVCEDRGDCFVLVDPVPYSETNIPGVTDRAATKDTNYAAMYWPWIMTQDRQLGRNVWVPPSVSVAGVYAFNDKVAHPWFAPAGLNRGGLDTAIQAARKLTHSNRDELYESSVNPIATFPGQGVCVWGQKTLQKKASALDRVNVRRLMIKVKKFIASTSRFLLFEQNTSATRTRFLSIVNPYLEQVQANSGLTAFNVVMDDSNNPPDLVDRNILYGQIFVQPTRTAEFIVLDFTVQPTGATFPE